MNLKAVFAEAKTNYLQKTPTRVRIVDAFILSMVVSTILQVLYVVVGTKNPYNSFLSGIFSSAGTATFALVMRSQITDHAEFKVSNERALIDFICCSIVLHLGVINFLG